MNWIQRKIYLYNVTFGLYMLDWWERYLFNTLVVVLMWFIFYNSSRYVTDFCRGSACDFYGIPMLYTNSALEVPLKHGICNEACWCRLKSARHPTATMRTST